MKQETNKTAGPEAGGTSGQSVHRSKFRQKSQQEQTAASKFRMEERGEKLERAKDKLAKQKPPTVLCMARFMRMNRKTWG